MTKRRWIIALSAVAAAALSPQIYGAGAFLFDKVVEANLLVAFDALAFGLLCL